MSANEVAAVAALPLTRFEVRSAQRPLAMQKELLQEAMPPTTARESCQIARLFGGKTKGCVLAR